MAVPDLELRVGGKGGGVGGRGFACPAAGFFSLFFTQYNGGPVGLRHRWVGLHLFTTSILIRSC